jgi:Fuc2NAc and GlcNAc transferase
MSLFLSLACVLALVASTVLTGVARNRALSHGALDVPNPRSSHAVATPRGGGIAVVIVVVAALCILAPLGRVDLDLFVASLGGIPVALVGHIDDRRGVSPGVRLLIHFVSAGWALAWLGGLPPLQVGPHVFVFGPFGYVLGAVGMVWVLNLFNFMDGIDGIAASEAAFIAFAGALLASMQGASGAETVTALIFGTACVGFLVWNWPPAKVFMGDVGSGYLGFLIAVLAVACARHNPVALFVWVILGGVFFIDASITFVRRLSRGEAVHVAHRSHAYQWLARRWASHRRVTLLVLVVNVAWLMPAAYLAVRHPRYAGWVTLVALLPIIVGTLWADAGRREEQAG